MSAISVEAIRLAGSERAECVRVIRTGSRSFHAASLLLPARTREAARALYAFCRSSDDLVDECEAGALAGVSAVQRLQSRLDAIYAGRPANLLPDRAFAELVDRHAIPRAVPDAMIEGFAWDEAGRDYETIEAVCDYAARVASTVGVMMTLIMGSADRHVLARAADLGLAMQLTNIARDVGEDARRGRLYLPRGWLVEEGLDPVAFLANPSHSPALARVVHRLLLTADLYYARAMPGTCALPHACRPAIRSAALIYRAIGRDIEMAGFDSVTRRARTSGVLKLGLIGRATLWPVIGNATQRALPADAATRFLVDAAARDVPQTAKGIDAKFGRFIELIAAAEARERGLAIPPEMRTG